MSDEIYGVMWKKASELVSEPNCITAAPGLATSRMVRSYSKPQKPHLVTFFKNGKVTCDCLNYSTKSICAHALATAEKVGLLSKLVEWYKKTNKGVNLWSLARSSGVPKSPGSKPQSRKRCRKALRIPQVKTTSSLLNKSPSKSPPSKCTHNPSAAQVPSSACTSASIQLPSHTHNPSATENSLAHGASIQLPPMHSTYQYPYQYYPQGYGMLPYYGCTSTLTSSHYAGFSSLSGSVGLQTVYQPSISQYPFTLKFITSRISKCKAVKCFFDLDHHCSPHKI